MASLFTDGGEDMQEETHDLNLITNSMNQSDNLNINQSSLLHPNSNPNPSSNHVSYPSDGSYSGNPNHTNQNSLYVKDNVNHNRRGLNNPGIVDSQSPLSFNQTNFSKVFFCFFCFFFVRFLHTTHHTPHTVKPLKNDEMGIRELFDAGSRPSIGTDFFTRNVSTPSVL